MILKLVDSGDAIFDSDLDVLESEVGTALPHQYRKFLLKSNGGQPSPGHISVNGVYGGFTDVQFFLGIRMREYSLNISWATKQIQIMLAMRVVAIAWDSSGCAFAIMFNEEGGHCIVYVDLIVESRPIYDVAPNFDAFIAKIGRRQS